METLSQYNTIHGKVYIVTSNKEITKKNISKRLVAKIKEFCQSNMLVYGPVEIKKLRIMRKRYDLDVILHRCAEDEMGFHNYRYKDLSLNKDK